MSNQEHVVHGRTGLAKHASTAAFTTARAVTSHIRHRFHTRYRGKYRFAPFVFGFDLTLLVLAAFLVGLNIYLFTALPAQTDAYRLDLVTSALRTAAPVALEARVTPVGPDPREEVRLFWKLPAGTEILEAFPPVGTDGSVSFGSMTSGQSSSSRLVVRLLTPQNVATFSFRVQDRETVVNGIASRRIIGSGLVLEPLIPLGSVVQEAVILYRLANETNLPIDDVRIGTDPVGRLEPFEERVIPFFPTTQGPVQARASVKGVTVVDRLESYALLSSDPTGVRLSLNPSVGSELSFRVSANRPASVAVWHPGLSDAHHLRVLDVPAGETDIRLPVQPVSGVSEWYVIRFQKRPDGNALGTFASAPISTPFTIHTTGRYYAVSGDQIGIGPLPPQVGETTKLWIGLRLGPTTADLSNVRVRIKLAPGVLVTGRDALADGGSFTETDTELVWNLGYLPTDSDGAGASFEIQLTPNKSQKGSVPVLVESVVAEAVDVRADLPRIATNGFVDLNLPEDEVGKNLGTVK